jgi:hypothetical protein
MNTKGDKSMPTVTLTVREIAQKIQLPDEDLTTAINRARNWTREGLLPTVGEKHPGIGRERLYPRRAILDAVLLQALTSAIGMTAVGALPVLKSVLKEILKDVKNLLAAQPREDTLIIASRKIGEKEWQAGVVWESRIHKWLATRRQYVHVILNAKTLYEQMEGANGDNPQT